MVLLLVGVIILLLVLQGIWLNFWLLGIAFLLIIIVIILNRLWFSLAVRTTSFERVIPQQAFSGDVLEAELVAHNGGKLPLPWVVVQDTVPSGLNAVPRLEWLISLRGEEKTKLAFKLECKHRGRYKLGPVEASAGVLFDAGSEKNFRPLKWNVISRLVVYPQVVPLEHFQLPSRLPMGNLRTRQPLLPDPSRIAGVREYQAGDDPRFIDWRNTARMSQILVKQFERTRYIPMAVFLDLRPPNGQYIYRQMAEASIVVSASLAYRANELKQSFGLFSNGYDPGWEGSPWIETLPPEYGRPEMSPRSGSAWLFEILDKLAGIEIIASAPPLEGLISRWSSKLPWGSTIVIVSFEPYPELVTEAGRLRKAGFATVLIFTGPINTFLDSNNGLSALRGIGIPFFNISQPVELNLSKARS